MTDESPEWSQLLDVFYSKEVAKTIVPMDDTPLSDDHPLKQNTDLSSDERIKNGIRYLEQTDLIESNRMKGEDGEYTMRHEIQPSADGLTVAHERQLNRQQNKLNQSLVAFTLILVLTNVAGLYGNPVIEKLTSLILLVGLAYLIFYADIL